MSTHDRKWWHGTVAIGIIHRMRFVSKMSERGTPGRAHILSLTELKGPLF